MFMSESTLSQASTKVGDDSKDQEHVSVTPLAVDTVKNIIHAATAQNVLLFLVAFRILNALTVRTFFQPDEYFQSLEPAWRMTFGKDSGAWITWEWSNHLRSAIHPSIFAAIYWASDGIAQALQLSPSVRDQLLLAAPKTAQAVFAAGGEYYTWKLAARIYGQDSSEAWAVLALGVASPWQWFCSTRTLSNCFETTLTIMALEDWPWHWSLTAKESGDLQVDREGLRIRDAPEGVSETNSLRAALLLAATATVMRPTNILIWSTLSWLTFLQHTSSGWLLKIPWTDQSAWVHTTSWSFVPNQHERITFFRETLVCGTLILLFSALIDRLYYQVWSLPPLNFLRFNVIQSLSIFYGNNDWHYYLSQGYPLLLTTALPFSIAGIYKALQNPDPSDSTSATSRKMLSQLATICLIVPLALSAVSHKEVRFIYPLLPALHVLAAAPLTSFFKPAFTQRLTKPSSLSTKSTTILFGKRLLLFTLVAVNAIVAIYTSTIHASGVISVTDYLREQHSRHYLSSSASAPDSITSNTAEGNMTVAFLMPCHSTPWRSHLIHRGIHAWALTCEPPLHLNATSRATYMDEADIFYANPVLWLRSHMSRSPPRVPGFFGTRTRALSRQHDTELLRASDRKRVWPDYLVFFAQLESVMHTALQGSGYGECWRGFNSHWHDDWRRTGDVVVWCLDSEKKNMAYHRLPESAKATRKKDVVGQVKAKVVDKVAQLAQPGPRDGNKALVGGGRGPYGIGSRSPTTDQQHKNKEKSKPKPRITPGELAVERPFWKKREKQQQNQQPESARWWTTYLWLFGRRKEKETSSSWWQGGKWS